MLLVRLRISVSAVLSGTVVLNNESTPLPSNLRPLPLRPAAGCPCSSAVLVACFCPAAAGAAVAGSLKPGGISTAGMPCAMPCNTHQAAAAAAAAWCYQPQPPPFKHRLVCAGHAAGSLLSEATWQAGGQAGRAVQSAACIYCCCGRTCPTNTLTTTTGTRCLSAGMTYAVSVSLSVLMILAGLLKASSSSSSSSR